MNYAQRLLMLESRTEQAKLLSQKLTMLEAAEPSSRSEASFRKDRNFATEALSDELLLEVIRIGRAELIRRVQNDLTAVLSEPLFPPEPKPKKKIDETNRMPDYVADEFKRRREQIIGTPPDMRPFVSEASGEPIDEADGNCSLYEASMDKVGADGVPVLVPVDLSDL